MGVIDEIKKNCRKELLMGKFKSIIYSSLFSILDKVFHELSSIVPTVPRCGQIKRIGKKLNSQVEIKPTPNNVVGVQQNS